MTRKYSLVIERGPTGFSAYVPELRSLAPVHEAQLLTYLRLGGWKIGLQFKIREANPAP